METVYTNSGEIDAVIIYADTPKSGKPKQEDNFGIYA